MRLDGRRVVSTPSTRTDPSRLGTIPMIDRRVVVLPAPLRPSSVTTSPPYTSKSMPCTMCDSPYQAFRPRTCSRGAALESRPWMPPVPPSGMPRPHVSLYDVGILRHRLVVAFGENLAAGQHGDAVGQRRDDGQVVLDHQHRAVGGNALDEGGDAADVFTPHALGRLVKQHHLRLEGKSCGDLERPLAAVRQLASR